MSEGATATQDPFAAIGLQPHAAAVLGAALPPDGAPSHAYLFHGPSGSGKRSAARAFATALLAEGAKDPAGVAARIAHGVHPDLTWVRPSGAAEMLVSDIDEPVVAAASRTPFEARRRVFVIEGADALNERAANKLLKTLEEPPSFVHLLLLAQRPADMLETIVSRCQQVRFDPAPPELIERRLASMVDPATADVDATDPGTVAACSRLCLGDLGVARRLASAEGTALRDCVETFAIALTDGESLAASKPWSRLLDAAKEAGAAAGEATVAAMQEDLELLPAADRRRREREAVDASRRAQRRERTKALDLGLQLLELWLRDLLCVCEGAPELIHAVDRTQQLTVTAAGLRSAALRAAVGIVAETRLRLAQNVSEELALEAMAHRLQATLSR
ncbi:MAG TPA: hypothetical protein VGF95_12845 [Solirubrobacteraceae bacterium]|jgi:DNA polymerase-3 subunit delta'